MKNCLLVESFAVSMLKKFCVKALAEEPVVEDVVEPVVETTPKQQINYEELIAIARREEKDKLYPQISRLKEDLKVMTKLNNDNLLKIAELEKSKGDNGAKEIEKLNKEIEKLKAFIENQPESISEEEFRTKLEAEIRESIEAEYEVKLFKTQKLSELKDEILPTFAELIKGDTKEALEASFEWAIRKTKETKEALGITDSKEEPVKPNRPSQTNPSNSTFDDKVFDADYIRNLAPDSKEWAEVRVALGLDKYNN